MWAAKNNYLKTKNTTIQHWEIIKKKVHRLAGRQINTHTGLLAKHSD